MIASSQPRTHTPRLNPFAFPSSTDFRFILLILSVLAASLYIYSYLYLSLPGKQEATDVALRSYQAVVAAHPSQSDADLQANIQAEKQYLVPIDRNEALWVSGCVMLELILAAVIFLALPRWRIWRDHLRSLDPSSMKEVSAYLTNLCNGAGLSRPPRFLWQPSNLAKTGLAFGCLGWYYVVLPAGLVQQFYSDRATFHAVVLHELAHLRNHDVDKTYFTISIWWAFVLVALVPILPRILYELYLEASLLFISLLSANLSIYFNAPIYHSGLNEGWRIIALTLLIYLTRNAVLQVREVYADARASIWDGRIERLVHILQSFPHPRGWLWLWSVHPDPEERIQALNDPTRLFYQGFWDAFGAGVAAMIAFPSFATFFYLLHIPGSVGGTGVAAVVGAGLVLAPLIAGVLSLGVWRAALFKLVYHEPSVILVQLALGLGLGMLLGQILSLQDYLFTLFFKYSQNFLVHFSFDVIWGILLLVSLLLLIWWLVVGVSTWLEIATVSGSPSVSYWVGTLVTGSVLAVWLGLLYGFRFMYQSTLPAPGSSDLLTLFNTVTEIPLTLFVFVSLWAYPLAPLFWRKLKSRNVVNWVFLEPSQHLILPSQPLSRLRQTVIASLIGGLVFFILRIIIGLVEHLVVPQAVQQTEAFYIPFGYSIVGLSMLIQAVVAAVVASQAQRLGGLQGLLAAFITGNIATIGQMVQIVVPLAFGHSLPDVAGIWIAVQTYFGLFVNGGALLALPVSLSASALAGLTRHSQQRVMNDARIETTPPSHVRDSQQVHPQRLSDGTRSLLVVLALLITLSSGIVCVSYAASQTPLNTILPQASPTPSVPQNPYSPYHGTLALDDPLKDNMLGNHWDDPLGCKFTAEGYLISAPIQGLAITCMSYHMRFNNFIYQVQIKVTQGLRGGVGGLVFRADPTRGSYYDFLIGQDGSYALYRYDSDGFPKVLRKSSSSVIIRGLNQSNVMAVIADGNTIDLYVNYRRIDSISDGIYGTGIIGVVADSLYNPSQVLFSSAKVWTL